MKISREEIVAGVLIPAVSLFAFWTFKSVREDRAFDQCMVKSGFSGITANLISGSRAYVTESGATESVLGPVNAYDFDNAVIISYNKEGKEIITPFNPTDPRQRMKIRAIASCAQIKKNG